MKICVTSTGPDLKSQVDPRFGRCSYFIFVDTDTMKFESFDNSAAGTSGGAGIQSARFVSDRGTEIVLTGNLGPNATTALQAAGITMYIGATGVTIQEAVTNFKNGAYKKINTPSVESHYGMNTQSGRGMGMGRGMRNMQQPSREEYSPSQKTSSNNQNQEEIEELKEQAKNIESQLNKIQEKINDLSEDKSTEDYISVDEKLCTGCGICMDICPMDAITINSVAKINASLCKGCAVCVNECPVNALIQN